MCMTSGARILVGTQAKAAKFCTTGALVLMQLILFVVLV